MLHRSITGLDCRLRYGFLYQRCHSEGQYIAQGEEEEIENEKDERRVWGEKKEDIFDEGKSGGEKG